MVQAGRRWQRTLYPWLSKFGFVPLHADPNVFVMRRGQETLILGCYVDDLFTLHSHSGPGTLYDEFISELSTRFDVEDEGVISDLLNVEIAREGDDVVLRQRGYIDRLVETYAPDGVPDAFTSQMTPAGPDLAALVEQAIVDNETPTPESLRRYQSIIGSLLYCSTHTRPDVAYAVGLLSRAMSRPTVALHAAAVRVVYYLHRHRDLGLRYSPSDAPLKGYSDSDWATRHSTSGSVFLYCTAAISWASRKQATVALSSCEAEIVAASEAAKEAVYLSRFLQEMEVAEEQPTELCVDNQAAIDLSYNDEHHRRTKHIERRHFYIRECVERHLLRVPFVRSADNLADFFTKSLSPAVFFPMRDLIMNVHPCQSSGGDCSASTGGIEAGQRHTPIRGSARYVTYYK